MDGQFQGKILKQPFLAHNGNLHAHKIPMGN